MIPHRVFGQREDVPYLRREGVYLIPHRGDLAAVIRTPKGLFLLGGGLEPGESPEDCLIRECREESGHLPLIGERICSAETFAVHPTLGYFHPVQTYYAGDLAQKVCPPTEGDHTLLWVEYSILKGTLFSPMQNWALDEAFKTPGR